MGANDKKRFISATDNAAFAAEMSRRMEGGEVPPFGVLFPETICDYLTDDEKADAHIIQISFLITNRRNEIFLTRRASHAVRPGIGHTLSTGDSILTSWSPVDSRAREFPQSDADLLRLFREEVEEGAAGHQPAPEFRFLGLIRSDARGPRYYFYVYEAHYDLDAPIIGRVRGRDPQRRLRKDRADDLVAFVPWAPTLRERLAGMQADLAAVSLWRGEPRTALVDDARVCAVRWQRNDPAPHLTSIPDAFISHTTADDAIATRMSEELQGRGLQPWTDHVTLSVGQKWYREIRQGVRYARCFVPLCSRASLASAGVRDEIALALQARARWGDEYPIFPLVLEGARREEFLFPEFRGRENGIHVLDLRDPGQRPRHLASLADTVARLRVRDE